MANRRTLPSSTSAAPVRGGSESSFWHRLRWCCGLWRMLSAVPRGSPGIGEAEAVVSRQNYVRLLGSLRLPDRLPLLTRFEKPLPGEASAILQMANLAASTVVENYCDAARRGVRAPAMRDQHAKPHGCLHGS